MCYDSLVERSLGYFKTMMMTMMSTKLTPVDPFPALWPSIHSETLTLRIGSIKDDYLTDWHRTKWHECVHLSACDDSNRADMDSWTTMGASRRFIVRYYAITGGRLSPMIRVAYHRVSSFESNNQCWSRQKQGQRMPATAAAGVHSTVLISTLEP